MLRDLPSRWAIFLALCVGLICAQAPPAWAQQVAQNTRLTPSQLATLHSIGATLASGGSEASVSSKWRSFIASGGFTGNDIEELLFLVMKESVKQANEDKKNYLGKMKTANERRDELRRLDVISNQLRDDAIAAGGNAHRR